MKKATIIMAVLMILAFSNAMAITDTYTKITFEVTSASSISISYQSPCTQTSFACRWPGGTQVAINITDTSGSVCQTNANYALRVTNDGTITIAKLNMSMNQSLTGVTVKYHNTTYDYANAATLTTATQATATNIASGANKDYWFWCDFSSFNGGIAATNTSMIYHNVSA
jgi:hypothetical protein